MSLYPSLLGGGDQMNLIDDAVNTIYRTYGDKVSLNDKGKSLLKFGRNPSVGTTRCTIWYTGQDELNETYVADNVNSIDTISSSSASDTEIVKVEGHTMSGNNLTFVVQTATLNGQNKVTLSTPLNRITRIAHNDDSATNLVGEIYGYEDTAISGGKPTDTSKIHITVPAGHNQSQKASTSISSTDYWIVSEVTAGYIQKSGSNIAELQVEVRSVGGVFKPATAPISIKTGDSKEIIFEPYIIIPKNSDVRLTVEASAGSQNISGEVNGFLAKIIG